MIQDRLEKELDKKKFFVVRYSEYLVAVMVGIILFLLYHLKIGDDSILRLLLDYYFSTRK